MRTSKPPASEGRWDTPISPFPKKPTKGVLNKKCQIQTLIQGIIKYLGNSFLKQEDSKPCLPLWWPLPCGEETSNSDTGSWMKVFIMKSTSSTTGKHECKWIFFRDPTFLQFLQLHYHFFHPLHLPGIACHHAQTWRQCLNLERSMDAACTLSPAMRKPLVDM